MRTVAEVVQEWSRSAVVTEREVVVVAGRHDPRAHGVRSLPTRNGIPHGHQPPERVAEPLVVTAVLGIVLYAVPAARFLALWRARRAVMLRAMAAAFVLLAEALIAVVYPPSWHLSWWDRHALMLLAFALVAWGARAQWHEGAVRRPLPGPAPVRHAGDEPVEAWVLLGPEDYSPR
ncbi:MAG: hypothetical protein ACXVYY_07935 [Oryzihumus sp.]